MANLKKDAFSSSEEDDFSSDSSFEYNPKDFDYNSDVLEIPEFDEADELNEETLRVIAEINRIINAKCDSDVEDALALNREMQLHVRNWQQRLREILLKIDLQLKQLDEEKATRSRKKGPHGWRRRGNLSNFDGSSFFMDLNFKKCPSNEDYERRRKEGEWFPMDFFVKPRHFWSSGDKKNILDGVKQQALVHLSYKDRIERGPRHQRDLRKYKINDLIQQLDESFEVDWLEISVHNVKYRHAPTSCKAMWEMYLHPSIPRSNLWNEDTNKLLVETASSHNNQNWAAIAADVNLGYSEYQCFIQFRTVARNYRDYNPRFTKAEDTKLVAAVKKCTVNGMVNWNLVCAQFPDRSKSHVRTRYQSSLDPSINHKPFTKEEDILLLSLVAKYGEKFSSIPRHYFPDRSKVQLRTHYALALKYRGKQSDWSLEDDRLLVEFVEKNGFDWKKCELEVFQGCHLRVGCRTRYLLIKKFLDKNPGAPLDLVPRRCLTGTRQRRVNTDNWMAKLYDAHEGKPPKPKTESKRPAKPRSRKRKEPSDLDAKPSTSKKRKKDTVSTPDNLESVVAGTRKRRASRRDPALPKPKRIRRTKKPLYVDRLRAVGLKLYNAVKYAFNFRFGVERDFESSAESLVVLHKVAKSLNFVLPKNGILEIGARNLSMDVYEGISCSIIQNPHLFEENDRKLTQVPSLPPSYSSALGLRSLYILYAQSQAANKGKSKELTLLQRYGDQPAVRILKERMRILFIKTILLSRINDTESTKTRLSKIMAISRGGADDGFATSSVKTVAAVKVEKNLDALHSDSSRLVDKQGDDEEADAAATDVEALLNDDDLESNSSAMIIQKLEDEQSLDATETEGVSTDVYFEKVFDKLATDPHTSAKQSAARPSARNLEFLEISNGKSDFIKVELDLSSD